MRLGLRTRLLIVSSVLLALPWLGLRAAREIETFLVETQEQGLASTARAVATALNERPAVFVVGDGSSEASGGGADRPTLRIETLSRPIVLDGNDADWRDQRGEMRELEASAATSASPAATPFAPPPPTAGSSPSPTPSPAPTPAPIQLRYRLGRYERGIFALIEVRDETVVAAEATPGRPESSDRVEVAMVTADDEFLRFVIQPTADGGTVVSHLGVDGTSAPDTRLEAAFALTATGYRMEVRIPRTLVGARLALAALDVDDADTRITVARAGTSFTDLRDELSRVFVPSPELSALAEGLGRARSRLWVLDDQGRVLAQAGTLQGSRAPLPPPTWRQQLVMTLRPLYGSILVEPTEDFTDQGPDATRLQGGEISQALQGKSSHWRRRTTDGRAVVLSAAEPVWSDGRVVGAVLAEETTNETLAARNRAFERLFFSIALVVFFGAALLILFASRLSSRIRRLRDSVERAIDRQGRVRGEIEASTAQDEIGDLSRSFGSMLERQRQYTAYLEALRGRLSHEIRTPVAIVRSSLDNLRLQKIPDSGAVYLDRADDGLSRLITIVQRMTEASRLEQTLATSEREPFDITRVLSGCVDGYRLAHPTRMITLTVDGSSDGALPVVGAPDLVAQLMDKLVENALDFAKEGTPVEVRLARGIGTAILSVSNEGPPLTDDVAPRLFESMVSSRPADANGRVHLGLGLTIVRAIADFHDATVAATNRRDVAGVTFTVVFPLASRG